MEREPTTEYEKSTITTDDQKLMTISHKSTTDEEKSPLAGTQQKIEEEDSESESEDEESESESESDEDVQPVEDWYADEPVEEILIDGEHFTSERLLDLIMYKDGDFAYRRTNKFLNKVRRYLKSVRDSNGFDISDWPGNVSGITHVVLKDYVIKERFSYPEGYKYVEYLANKAIVVYNKDHETEYFVATIEKVNSRTVQGYTYFITFKASDMNANDERTFQAKVWDDVTHREIHVRSCNLKPTRYVLL